MKIFVFGSNLAGRHGAGAVRHAYLHHGAIYGCGEGLQGCSYGIPTKDHQLCVRRLDEIRLSIDKLLRFVSDNPELTFQVTRIGCGLAGYQDEEIGPMFATALSNCELPESWETYRQQWRQRMAELIKKLDPEVIN